MQRQRSGVKQIRPQPFTLGTHFPARRRTALPETGDADRGSLPRWPGRYARLRALGHRPGGARPSCRLRSRPAELVKPPHWWPLSSQGLRRGHARLFCRLLTGLPGGHRYPAYWIRVNLLTSDRSHPRLSADQFGMMNWKGGCMGLVALRRRGLAGNAITSARPCVLRVSLTADTTSEDRTR